MKKISICTVCMNRLIHLSQTLPSNINDNKDYPEIEFVVLNYNSRDEMDDWVKTYMKSYIDAGILKYYKTIEPEYFHLSHSKNMAMKLATGNIVCMVDADNYAGPGYAGWINNVFADNGDNTIVTTLRPTYIPFRDQGGKFAFSRELLHHSRGMDETLEGYGVDDVDLINRIERLGGNRYYIEDQKFLRYISHSNIDRLRNFHLLKNLREVYLSINYSSLSNDVLYFLNDSSFFHVTYEYMEDQKADMTKTFNGWGIRNAGYRQGVSIEASKGILLSYNDATTMFLSRIGVELSVTDETGSIKKWKLVNKHDSPYYPLLMSYGECFNRLKLSNNAVSNGVVNEKGWGNGKVFLNFDFDNPIVLEN